MTTTKISTGNRIVSFYCGVFSALMGLLCVAFTFGLLGWGVVDDASRFLYESFTGNAAQS